MTDLFHTRFHVVIPCAGSGSRSGSTIPKQYQPLAGSPMVVHTLNAFSKLEQLGQGVLVVAPDDQAMSPILQRYPQSRFVISRSGGTTRAQSVLAGLKALHKAGVTGGEWVMVHDAARCLITPELIEKLWISCQPDTVGGLLALPVADTLKSAENDRVISTLPRNDKWLAQTPQMFRLNDLTSALEEAGDQVTDEASALEAMGLSPKLITGEAFNFKVTYPYDFQMAEAVLASRLIPTQIQPE